MAFTEEFSLKVTTRFGVKGKGERTASVRDQGLQLELSLQL